jgi:hypothetical protein
MPHSIPASTSATLSLKRRNEPTLPLQTIVPSRTRRVSALRVTLPSFTWQPAIVPTFEALNVCRISAPPSVSSTSSGSSSPSIAARSSSVTL